MQELNPTGKGILCMINLALRSQNNPAISAPLENIFEFFVDQGLSVQTIVPQKALLQEAGSRRIRQLIDSQLQRIALLEHLNEQQIQKALTLLHEHEQKEPL